MIDQFFECFFSTISDYLRARDLISFKFHCVVHEDFILTESVKCKERLIELNDGNVFFCFLFSISDDFPRDRPSKEIKKHITKIKQLNFFKEEHNNNFICKKRHINSERDEHGWLKGGKYLFDHVVLVKYAYKRGLFQMDLLPEDIKTTVEAMINISDEMTRSLKRRVIKFGDLDADFVALYKED